MFGLDRRTLHVAWTLFLFALALAAIYSMRRTLVIFTLALFLAHLLGPVVQFAQRFVPQRTSRTLALLIVYVVLLGAITTALIQLGSRIGQQATLLAGKLPAAMQTEDPFKDFPLPTWLEPARDRVTEVVRQRVEDLDKQVLPILSRAGEQILSGLGNVLSVILIPILSFFFLKDGTAMRAHIVQRFAPAQQTLVNEIFLDLHVSLAQYIRALVLLALATLIFYFAFLGSVGISFAILLAGIAAMLEFIPVVGPMIGGAVILVVAVFTHYPHIWWIVVFLGVYRIFQDYVLNPYLMSSGVEIHPLLVLFGVLAGEEVAGIPGMFFSVPIMAALRVLVHNLRKPAIAAE
jgi:predicted PurR-regulated permease PerM